MFFGNRTVCETMWRNIVEPDGPQIIRRMRIVEPNGPQIIRRMRIVEPNGPQIIRRMRIVEPNGPQIIWCMRIVEPDGLQIIRRMRIVEPGGPQIIRRMLIACRISEFTDTHSEYATLIVFPRQQWLRETRLCYVYSTHIACLVLAFCGQWYQRQRYANLCWEEEQYLLQDTA